jgi:hypothetical protein
MIYFQLDKNRFDNSPFLLKILALKALNLTARWIIIQFETHILIIFTDIFTTMIPKDITKLEPKKTF